MLLPVWIASSSLSPRPVRSDRSLEPCRGAAIEPFGAEGAPPLVDALVGPGVPPVQAAATAARPPTPARRRTARRESGRDQISFVIRLLAVGARRGPRPAVRGVPPYRVGGANGGRGSVVHGAFAPGMAHVLELEGGMLDVEVAGNAFPEVGQDSRRRPLGQAVVRDDHVRRE